MTLALLITAATGAWAQEETLLTTITATGTDSYSETTPGVVTVTHDNSHFDGTYGWLWWSHAGSITVEAKEGYTITRCVFSQPYKTPFTVSTAPFKVDFIETADPGMPEFKQYMCQGDWFLNMDGVSSIEVYGYVPAPATDPDAIDVTTDAAEEGATFTEASFEMPTSDVTVNYELVRDMSVQMTATMGDGTDGLRYRVKKSEQNPGKYEPADMNMLQVLTLIAVNDGIEQKALTLNQDYFCRIYKLDEQTQQPDGDGVELADFDFAPGLYALKAFATDGSNYDGETALSNTFKLFQGYEVEVPAGEYITYYKDEALYVEDTDAKLYTITAVSGTTATADELTIAPANTPLLVKNNGSETKTILLIPTTTDTPDNVTPYEGFTGTLEAATIAASDATQDNYAWNGLQFVRVKTALSIAANKAWLQVPATASAPQRIQIVFSSTTGIGAIDGLQSEGEGAWYDLNGRRLPGKPTKKGVYILNGKKMVVK